MQFHSHANQIHFHKNGFELRLALKQRDKGTRKWPIKYLLSSFPFKISNHVPSKIIRFLFCNKYRRKKVLTIHLKRVCMITCHYGD